MKPGTLVAAYISTLKDIRQPLASSQERISDNVLIGNHLDPAVFRPRGIIPLVCPASTAPP
jgi:hypothetical protein